MKSSIGSPTKNDLERFRRLQELGAIDVIIRKRIRGTPGDVHHLLDGGQRISHQHTICLTPWAHRGLIPTGFSKISATEKLGPSKVYHPARFIEVYGFDEELLAMTNQLLEAMAKARAA